jgi:hypothetical protein
LNTPLNPLPLLLLGLLPALPLHAAPLTPASLAPRADSRPLNPLTQELLAAGQIRIQSQRLAKLYLQTAAGILPDVSRSQLTKAIQQGDAALNTLGRLANGPAARHYLKTQDLWLTLKAISEAPYTVANADKLIYLSDELMLASGRLGNFIEAQADNGTARLLDLSLRQNMLAQRLARLYMQAQLGNRSQGLRVDMAQARSEFDTALHELATAPENNDSSRGILEIARNQWIFFNQAVGDGPRFNGNRDVATTSERILEMLDSVSQLYLNAGQRVKG